MTSKPTADELEAAANQLLKAGAAQRQARRPWAIHADLELEASLSGAAPDGEGRRQYAKRLRQLNDPRGELAHLFEAGDATVAQRFIKRHSELLFGAAARRVALKHITVDEWALGMVERATIHLGKTTMNELLAFAHCPAARFLSSLTVTFTDTNDNAITKVQAGRRQLEDVVAMLRRAPCAGSLRVLRVKSIDPRGQPPGVLTEKTVLPPATLKPFRGLVECGLTFDSE